MLDADQQKVVDKTEGFYCVTAGAGSGKTATVVNRAARLSELGSVLCLSFTAEASKNMKERAAKLFPTLDSNIFSTVHSLALRFAHDYSDAYSFKLEENPLAVDGVAARAVFDATKNKINYQVFTTWVSLQKRNRTTPQEAINEASRTGKNAELAVAYKAYQQDLRSKGVMDFDDLICEWVNVLESRPDIRLKQQVNYLMVDEAQDCSEIEWRLFQLLTEKHKNFLAVGDFSQAIYSFRGGKAEHFREMENLFPGTQKLILGNNYRSTRNIVNYIKKACSDPQVAEHFKAISEVDGALPIVKGYSTDYSEAEDVVKQIDHLGPENCAVLARTNQALRAVEEECINQNIKYHILGDSGFWNQPEVLNVLAFVRCSYSPTDNSVLTALRTPFHLTKFLKKKVIADETKSEVQRTGKTAWEILKDNPKTRDFTDFIKSSFQYRNLAAGEAVKRIISQTGALSHYKDESEVVPDRDPLANLRELSKVADKYSSVYDFLNFVRKVSGATRTRKGVCLTTIHRGKGKEWDNVFLISANLGLLPHSKSTDIQEERHLFYVAVSRPRNRIHVSWHTAPSPFIGGM